MPATSNKQQLLNLVFTTLKKRSPQAEEPSEQRTILEHLIYAICREETTREMADLAFQNLLPPRFIDWNEVRVSTIQELEESLASVPNPGERAQRIIGVLQEWFELTYSFDMEEIAETAKKKGLKEGSKKIARLKEVDDFILAWVIQQGFGGHAIPLDEATSRVLRRLGVIDGETDDLEAIRGSIEHNVPKARGAVFVDLLAMHAQELCTEENPNCPACPLNSDCPTGIEVLRTRVPEPKPRKSR